MGINQWASRIAAAPPIEGGPDRSCLSRPRLKTIWLLFWTAFLTLGLTAGAAHAAPKVTAQVKNGTLRVTGTGAGQDLVLRLAPSGRLVIDVGDNGSADFSFRRSTFKRIVVKAGSGDDLVEIDEVNGQFTNTEMTTLDGQAGLDTLLGGSSFERLIGGTDNDIINGGSGDDRLIGGTGNDTLVGDEGADTALMGAGEDTFVVDPGDGNDTVEGQEDQDTLTLNGSAGAEVFAASPDGDRLSVTRDVGNMVLDVDDVETLTVNALGGADTITINDLAATDVSTVNLDLGVAAVGDFSADAVTVNGTVAVDLMSLSGGSGSVTLLSPAITLQLTHAEPALDTLTINTSDAADIVSASALANSSIRLTINGGNQADILVGSQGNDTINGDAGDDLIRGDAGNDTLDGGADTDTIDGGSGTDTAVNGETVTNVP